MVTESEKSKHDMLRAMRKHIRENGITDFIRALRNTSTGAFIREEAKPVAGFISEEGYGR